MTASTTYICDRCGKDSGARVEVEVHVFSAIRKLHYCKDCWPVYAVETAKDYEGRARQWLDAIERAMREMSA